MNHVNPPFSKTCCVYGICFSIILLTVWGYSQLMMRGKFHDWFLSLKLYFPKLHRGTWPAQDSYPAVSFLPKLPWMFFLYFFQIEKIRRRKNYLMCYTTQFWKKQHLRFVPGNWGAMAPSAYVSLSPQGGLGLQSSCTRSGNTSMSFLMASCSS